MPQPEKVAQYYDEWNEQYRNIYGEVIQAFRPADTKEMLESIYRSMNLQPGMKLLDAGCGFGGPAVYFASKTDLHIDAITVSPAQLKEATENVKRNKLESKIEVKQGDYHQLAGNFAAGAYDGVFFLESLGHNNDLNSVISGVWQLLKPQGFVYIKDFFYKETNNPQFNARVNEVVRRVNENYCYNVMSLIELLKVLRAYGFIIEYIRQPDFVHDIAVRKKFEDDNNIDNYGEIEEFYYSEWLEIKCIKMPY